MEISTRALIIALHGLLFGGFFLLAVFGLLVELIHSAYSSNTSELTKSGLRLAALYLWITAGLVWTAVLIGTYLVYPLYRAVPPPGNADLALFPQALLLASSNTSGWHRLGMEWKEHVAWIAPIAATMVAYVMIAQRSAMKGYAQLRKAVITFALVAFTSAAIAAFFGAMINKHAPVEGRIANPPPKGAMMPTSDTGIPQTRWADQAQPPGELVANGPAAAAILSAGTGSCALGILAVGADGSNAVGRWLAFYRPSGPLSGVTTVTIVVWLVLWFVLAKRWRVRNVNLAKTNALAFILLACGLLLTFPPFGDLLLGK